MTGESLPVDKSAGDEVFSGTVNQFGAFEMQATKVGEDSSIQRMIRLVQSADAGKAKIVGLADRWATWIVVIALKRSGPHLAHFRRNHSGRHYFSRVLSLRACARNAHGYYGGHWQCYPNTVSSCAKGTHWSAWRPFPK